MTVTGDKELDRQLRDKKRGVRKTVVKATRKAASQATKEIKSKISTRSVKKAIGWRLVRKPKSAEEIDAKIGAAVGKKSKRATSVKERGGRPGVGIDRRNVHWWFLGTAERSTGSKRSGGHRGGNRRRVATGGRIRRTGKMPPQDRPISVLFNQGGALTVLRTFVDLGK